MKHEINSESGPEATQNGSRVVICAFCGGRLKAKQLQYHFRLECQKCPKPSSELKICSDCQKPLHTSDFSKSIYKRDGLNTACKICSAARWNSWRKSERAKNPDRTRRKRPLGWVLSPCPHCGIEYGVRALIKHKPRCEMNQRGRPRVAHPGAPLDMATQVVVALSKKQRTTKNANLMFQYGITLEDWDKMYAAQDGKCAICKQPPPASENTRTNRFHVDHDHATGRVRGLLCHLCNVGVGHFREDVSLLSAAAEYLRRFAQNP